MDNEAPRSPAVAGQGILAKANNDQLWKLSLSFLIILVP